MSFKNLAFLRYDLTKPCKKMLQLFKFKLRRPVFIRSLQFRHRKPNIKKKTHKGRLSRILPTLCSVRRTREMDRITELKSYSDAGHHKAPFPSPLTPAYVRMSLAAKRDAYDHDDVDDACRSFENYLTEMIVEKGQMGDLVDVEELLYCSKNLRCPVYIDLVSQFYRELCKDLFSNNNENSDHSRDL